MCVCTIWYLSLLNISLVFAFFSGQVFAGNHCVMAEQGSKQRLRRTVNKRLRLEAGSVSVDPFSTSDLQPRSEGLDIRSGDHSLSDHSLTEQCLSSRSLSGQSMSSHSMSSQSVNVE